MLNQALIFTNAVETQRSVVSSLIIVSSLINWQGKATLFAVLVLASVAGGQPSVPYTLMEDRLNPNGQLQTNSFMAVNPPYLSYLDAPIYHTETSYEPIPLVGINTWQCESSGWGFPGYLSGRLEASGLVFWSYSGADADLHLGFGDYLVFSGPGLTNQGTATVALRISGLLDGIGEQPSTSFSSVLGVSNHFGRFETSHSASHGDSTPTNLSHVLNLSFPVVFGGTNLITADLVLTARVGAPNWGGLVDAKALFGNTVHWNGVVEVRNAEGQVVNNWIVTSTSGINYATAITLPELTLQRLPTPSQLRLSWTGGWPPFTVQSASNLSPVDWSDLITTTQNNLTIPASPNPMFFRIVSPLK